MSLKKFAWSGPAVLLAAVMALGIIARPAYAANEASSPAPTITRASDAAQTATTYTVTFTNGTVGGANNTVLVGGDVITVDFTGAGAATDIRMTGSSTFTPVAGFIGSGCTSSTVGAGGNAGVVVITLGAPCTVANDAIGVQFTLSNITNGDAAAAASLGTVATTAATADSVTATAASNTVATTSSAVVGSCTGGLCVDGFTLVPAGTTCNQAAITGGTRPGSAVADGSIAYSLCVHVSTASTNSIDAPTGFLDANDTPANGSVVTITVSLGVVSTGTSKTTTVITNPTGYATTNYRGGGNQVATDTAIASAKLGSANAVGSLTINLTSASGGTAAKVAVLAPSVLAVAPNITNVSPQYSSPTIGSDIVAQVTDGTGLGVNGQTLLVTVDKGYLVADAAFVSGSANANCAGANSKSLSLVSAGTNLLSRGGTATSGTVNFTFCASQLDAPGKATITVSNVSTTMANATSSISMAGRPAKIDATATGNSITAKVTDKDGNAVADGTPVRFTISSNAGAVSVANGCTTSTNGQATAVVALTAATGTVIVSADWNEGGTTATAATCATAGSQQVATSVSVPGGTSGGTGGAGSITSGTIPAAGGFGLIVVQGKISDVVAATGCPVSTMALWATIAGNFVTYVPGTTITAVNADFLAAFPNGFPAGTPLIGKCK